MWDGEEQKVRGRERVCVCVCGGVGGGWWGAKHECEVFAF